MGRNSLQNFPPDVHEILGLNASVDELNILDGASVSTDELNILDGSNTKVLFVGTGCPYTTIQSAIDAAVAAGATVGSIDDPANLYTVEYAPGVEATWNTHPLTGRPLTTSDADASGVIIRAINTSGFRPVERFYSTSLPAPKVAIRFDDGYAEDYGLTMGRFMSCTITVTTNAFTYRPNQLNKTELHGLINGDVLVAQATVANTDLVMGTVYYAKVLTTTTFELYTNADLATGQVTCTSTQNYFILIREGLYRDSHATLKQPLTCLQYAAAMGVPLSLAAVEEWTDQELEVTGNATQKSYTTSTNTVNCVGHGLLVGDVVMFIATGIPSNCVANTVYYVITAPNADTFTISSTYAGATKALGDAAGEGAKFYTPLWTSVGSHNLLAGMTVTPKTTVAGLTAGTVYHVHSVASSTKFMLATLHNVGITTVVPTTTDTVTLITNNRFTTQTLRRAAHLFGMEVMSHSVTHADGSTYSAGYPDTDADALKELARSREWLETLSDSTLSATAGKVKQHVGLRCKTFIQPGWAESKYIINTQYKQWNSYSRMIRENYASSMGYTGPSRRTQPHFGSNTIFSITNIASIIASPPASDTVYYCHQIKHSTSTAGETDLAAFKALIDQIATWRDAGLCVPVTVSQMFEDVPTATGVTPVRGGVPFGDFTGITTAMVKTTTFPWYGADAAIAEDVGPDGAGDDSLLIAGGKTCYIMLKNLIPGEQYRMRFMAKYVTAVPRVKIAVAHQAFKYTSNETGEDDTTLAFLTYDSLQDSCMRGDAVNNPYLYPAADWQLEYIGFTVPTWALATTITFSVVDAGDGIYLDDVSLEPNVVG